MRGKQMTFVWSTIDDLVVVNYPNASNLRVIPNPQLDRRGTSFVYDSRVFGKLTTNVIN